MFNLPNFNPRAFSDEQLIEKMAELTQKIMFMSYSSNGGSEMLMSMLESFRAEYQERQFMEHWRMYGPAMCKTIETEPDLRKDAKNDEAKKGEKPKRKRIEVPMRSDKPVIPDKD